MKFEDIIFKADFLNLTSDDKTAIQKIYDKDGSKENKPVDYFYDFKGLLLSNNEIKKIIKNKIFAGQTSVEWYKIYIEDINFIKENIRRLKYYNKALDIEPKQVQSVSPFLIYEISKDKYIIRHFAKTSSTRQKIGTDYILLPNITNTVSYIDLKNKFIEIRASSILAPKVRETIVRDLGIHVNDVIKVDVLSKFHNDIVQFAHSLPQGQFKHLKCAPMTGFDLGEDEKESMLEVINAIDNYFIEKDIGKLKDVLDNASGQISDSPFILVLLSGMDKLGLSVKEEDEEDLSNKLLYGCSKNYVDNLSAFITFEQNGKHTIQIGIKTNNIVFRSSSSEEVIELIRTKIL